MTSKPWHPRRSSRVFWLVFWLWTAVVLASDAYLIVWSRAWAEVAFVVTFLCFIGWAMGIGLIAVVLALWPRPRPRR